MNSWGGFVVPCSGAVPAIWAGGRFTLGKQSRLLRENELSGVPEQQGSQRG